MKRTLLATTFIIPLTASAALAFGGGWGPGGPGGHGGGYQPPAPPSNYLNVTQSVHGMGQTATNSISSSNLDNIEQTLDNVANMIVFDVEGGDVSQTVSKLGQLAKNTIHANGFVIKTEQEGSNLSNVVSSAALGDVNQKFWFSSQVAENSISANPWQNPKGPTVVAFNEVGQTATNVANLVDAEEAGKINQNFMFASQTATNSLGASKGLMTNIDQAASNSANIVTLESISATLTQSAAKASQVASNSMSAPGFGAGSRDLTQSATNVTNLALLGDIGASTSVSQSVSSYGQLAQNSIQMGNGGVISQTGGNLANILTGISGD